MVSGVTEKNLLILYQVENVAKTVSIDDIEHGKIQNNTESPEELYIRGEIGEILYKALERLSAKEREIFLLRFIENESYKKISLHRDNEDKCKYGTPPEIKHTINLVRKKLQKDPEIRKTFGYLYKKNTIRYEVPLYHENEEQDFLEQQLMAAMKII